MSRVVLPVLWYLLVVAFLGSSYTALLWMTARRHGAGTVVLAWLGVSLLLGLGSSVTLTQVMSSLPFRRGWTDHAVTFVFAASLFAVLFAPTTVVVRRRLGAADRPVAVRDMLAGSGALLAAFVALRVIFEIHDFIMS